MPHAAGLYYEWHGPEDGEVLILSAGLGGSATYWAPNLAALAARFRVLLYDHRGTGRSDRALPEQVSIGDMADDLLALLDALGIESRNAHFVGHAIGGLIGLEIAVLKGLQRLVIVNGWSVIDPHTERCFNARVALLRTMGPEAFVHAQPIFLFPANWIAAHEDYLAQEAKVQLAHFPDIANVEKRIAAARHFKIWFDMPDAEILLLAAEDDILVPSLRSRKLADDLCETPRLATMAWGGHACNVTDPETFNRHVLEFLGS
jgi:aminoacrylate hydrolase